jgi:hypothetical protein
MTRPRNEIPKLRRHKAKNRAFFQFRGKRHYTGRWGTKEAEQEYRRLIAEVVLPGAWRRVEDHSAAACRRW